MWRRCFLAQATAPVIGSISLSSRWNSCSSCNTEITVAVAVRKRYLFGLITISFLEQSAVQGGQCPNCWWSRRSQTKPSWSQGYTSPALFEEIYINLYFCLLLTTIAYFEYPAYRIIKNHFYCLKNLFYESAILKGSVGVGVFFKKNENTKKKTWTYT